MKIQRYIRQLLSAAVVSLPSTLVMAQDIPSSGTWTTMTISAEQTISLTGDIQVKGPITIGNGNNTVNVTIKNETGKQIFIRNSKENIPTTDGKVSGTIFKLRKGSKLTIEGKEGSEVVFDGGAHFTFTDYKLTCGLDSVICDSSMFKTNGDLTLRHVIIQDYKTNIEQEGAIKIADQNEKCGKTTLENCTIQRCYAHFGGAIYCHSNQTHKDNVSSEECAISLTGTVIRQCVTECDGSGWGGVIRFRGGCKSDLKMKDCTMEWNYAKKDGSCVWWNAGGVTNNKAPMLTLDGCKFSNNRAGQDAGAVRLEGSFEFTGSPTVFQDNTCGRYGGAIQMACSIAGTQNSFNAPTCDYTLSDKLEVSGNTAGIAGGGISAWFASNTQKKHTTFNIYLKGMKIHHNTAGKNGGGISFMQEKLEEDSAYVFNVYMAGGQISDNEAKDSCGGGVYVDSFNIKSSSEKSGNQSVTVENNTASGINQNPFCGGGGIYLQHGEMHLQTANITGNKAVSPTCSGGGIRLEDGTFTMEAGNISNNTADGYGGGAFIYNSTDTDEEVTLSGGSITGNTAKKAGGGIAVYGNVDFNVTGIDIRGNTGRNGGGIFLHGQGNGKRTKMTYNNGIIRENKATATVVWSQDSTAYNKEEDKVSGMGGGIYAGIYSTLNLNAAGTIGIYENIADNGADDIFSAGLSGSGTPYNSITVPNVSQMTLAGFEEGGQHQLFWVEDYPTDDPEYDKGTKRKTTWDAANPKNKRYRDSEHVNDIYQVDIAGKDTTFTAYLCLTLGWSTGNIIIEKSGLGDRDNAIFKIYKGEGEEKTEYMTVILTKADEQADGIRRKTISVDNGTWTVEETSWSWAYTPDPGNITRELNEYSSVEARTFTFRNTPEDTPKHSESVKTNELDPATPPS